MNVPIWLIELKDWVQVLTPVVGAILVVFWTPIRNYCDNLFKEKITEPEEEQNKHLQQLDEKIDILIKDIESNQNVMRSLLHNEIFVMCKSAIERGKISPMELQNLDELYMAYHNLGGNGTAQRLYEEAQKLEIKNDR